ncbi:MAG: hypothetical protein JW731_02170 [Bacteroidales bacterium]|nr:hypothetical protein [Bacteroidales bacterium]
MAQTEKKGLSLYTKISIIINTLLFGITGIIYLSNGNNIIGIVLLAAGVMNIVYSLVTVKTSNLFFVVLNFLFALVALVVAIDFLTQKDSFFGMVWMIITLYYLITGFVLLLVVNKKKQRREV